jgi:hypothetical protein
MTLWRKPSIVPTCWQLRVRPSLRRRVQQQSADEAGRLTHPEAGVVHGHASAVGHAAVVVICAVGYRSPVRSHPTLHRQAATFGPHGTCRPRPHLPGSLDTAVSHHSQTRASTRAPGHNLKWAAPRRRVPSASSQPCSSSPRTESDRGRAEHFLKRAFLKRAGSTQHDLKASPACSQLPAVRPGGPLPNQGSAELLVWLLQLLAVHGGCGSRHRCSASPAPAFWLG